MNKYRVLINGQNFLLNFDGKIRKQGFYTTRVVYALNSEEAELNAMDLIRKDSALTGIILNKQNDSPKLYAEEIEGIEESDAKQDINTGFSWYTENEE